MSKKKLNKKEVLIFGKNIVDYCHTLAILEIDVLSTEVHDPKTGKHYQVVIKELV